MFSQMMSLFTHNDIVFSSDFLLYKYKSTRSTGNAIKETVQSYNSHNRLQGYARYMPEVRSCQSDSVARVCVVGTTRRCLCYRIMVFCTLCLHHHVCAAILLVISVL
jgi:hypothetical protein